MAPPRGRTSRISAVIGPAALAACAVLLIALGLGLPGAEARSPTANRTDRVASTQNTLTGNGLLGVSFGAHAFTIEDRAARLLGGRPRITVTGATICGLTEQMHWTQGLTLDLGHGKLVGYEVGPTTDTRLRALETAAGLQVGDTTATAKRLYGGRLTTSWAQDGSFTIRTSQGEITGFLAHAGPNGHPNPSGVVQTIGAGDEGCPALSP